MTEQTVPELHVWVHINYSGREILNEIGTFKIVSLNPVFSAFKENITKVFRLSAFPVSSYVSGKRFQMGETAAFLKVTGNAFPDNYPRTIPKEIADVRDAMLAGQLESPIPKSMWNPSEEEQVLAYGEFGTEVVVDLLMPMQIVTAWAVIETLFTDLFKAAIATKPSIAPLDKKGKPRQFYYSRFNDNDGMHSAYIATFNDPSIEKIIKDNGLNAMYVLRNVIAHKAGVCDDKYATDSVGLPWLPVGVVINQKVTLSGQQVHNLLVGGLHKCLDLIKQVDAWLVNNP